MMRIPKIKNVVKGFKARARALQRPLSKKLHSGTVDVMGTTHNAMGLKGDYDAGHRENTTRIPKNSQRL